MFAYRGNHHGSALWKPFTSPFSLAFPVEARKKKGTWFQIPAVRNAVQHSSERRGCPSPLKRWRLAGRKPLHLFPPWMWMKDQRWSGPLNHEHTGLVAEHLDMKGARVPESLYQVWTPHLWTSYCKDTEKPSDSVITVWFSITAAEYACSEHKYKILT